MKQKKSYSCPRCEAQLPLKHIFLLSNTSTIECSRCGYLSHPEKTGMWYVIATFIAVALPGKISLAYKDSFWQAIIIGLSCGLITYIAILVFVYKKIKFH